jgi:folate-dependent phosphoribosylglycinamide formyltransferase PurN
VSAGKPPIRIALLTLEALAAAEAVRRFVAENPGRIAMLALSDPFRPQRGGATGQAWRLLRHSGPRFLPYLLANFVLPRAAGLWPQRDSRAARTPLAPLCARLGIPAQIVADMNSPAFRTALRASGAQAIVTFHCDQILTAETIETLPLGGLNVHAGLLPDHRGPVPTIHALLEATPRFGVTIHRLVARIDAGAILAQAPLALPEGVSALDAARRLHEAAVPMLAAVLDDLAAGREVERAVTPSAYCGFPTAAQLRLLARHGRSAAGWGDVRRALRVRG